MRQRPKCPCCGKGVGQRRTEQQEVMMQDHKPPVWEATNGIVVSTNFIPYGSDAHGRPLTKHIRTVWDGESFYLGKYQPFCTGTCAIKFARAAYAKGWRLAS